MDDLRIIAAVQKRRPLYDKNDTRYNNRDAVRLLWVESAMEVGMEVEPMKKRWAYLRDYFMKQHRIIKLAKSGFAISRKKKWPLFDSMGFLVPFMQQRTSFPPPAYNGDEDEEEDAHSSLSPNLPSNISGANVSRPESPGTTSDPINLKRSSESDFVCPPKRLKPNIPSYHSDMNILSRQSSEEMDESEHFFKSLLPTVCRLDSVSALEFRIEVHNLLLKYVKSSSTYASPSCFGLFPDRSFSPDAAPEQSNNRQDNGEFTEGVS